MYYSSFFSSGGSLVDLCCCSLHILFDCSICPGRGGDTIRHLCRASKCKINVDRSEGRQNDGLREVTLVGSSTAISNAKVHLSAFPSVKPKIDRF